MTEGLLDGTSGIMTEQHCKGQLLVLLVHRKGQLLVLLVHRKGQLLVHCQWGQHHGIEETTTV